MTVWPARRLLAVLAGFTLAAMLAVLLPALIPPLLAALLAILALVVWDGWLLRQTAALDAVRTLPARAFVGNEAWIELRLSHVGPGVLRAELQDELPRDVAEIEPRFEGVAVPPGPGTALRYAVRPSARGDRALGPVWVYTRSPLGFLRRRAACAEGATLRVYPDTARLLRAGALDPKRLLAVLGQKPVRRRGDGMEFESLRDYVPGDDPRRLDWAASARRSRAVVRVHQHERNHVVLIAVDASRLMAARTETRSKLDCAVESTIALALSALGSGDRVGLAVFDRTLRAWLAPRARRAALGAFVEALRPVRPRAVEADYGALLRELALRQRQRALIVVLTDFVEAESARLAEPLALLARRHRLMLVAIRDPLYAELEAPAAGGPAAGLQRRIVLDDLLHERETALASLRRRGVETLDLFPEEITGPLLNRYLALRYGPER